MEVKTVVTDSFAQNIIDEILQFWFIIIRTIWSYVCQRSLYAYELGTKITGDNVVSTK